VDDLPSNRSILVCRRKGDNHILTVERFPHSVATYIQSGQSIVGKWRNGQRTPCLEIYRRKRVIPRINRLHLALR
jgi:hypothetical protein